MLPMRHHLHRFALFAMIVGVVACSPADDDVQTAEAWLIAYEEGDAAKYQSLMNPEATYDCFNCGYPRETTGYFTALGGAEQDVRDSRLVALGEGTLNPTCVADGDLTSCTTERISRFGYVDDDGEPTQVDRSIYEFQFDDGQITHLTVSRTGGNLFDFNKVQGYRLWVEDQHPEDYDNLFFLNTILIDQDDTFARHQELADKYLNASP